MKDESAFRRRLYASYASSLFGHIRSISRRDLRRLHYYYRALLGRHLPRSRAAAILDVGCGYGGLVHFLHDLGYHNARGIDVSGEQVAHARRLGVASVEEADALAYLRGRTEQYDLILAFDLIEHLTRPELFELLDAALAALKPGGRLIVQTPNSSGPFGSWYRYYDLTHELAFTPTSIAQALRTVGFTNVSVHEIKPAIHSPISAVRFALWHAIRLALIAYIAIETGLFRNLVFSLNLLAVAQKPPGDTANDR